MRKLIIILLAVVLFLGACSTARQKLSPQANVNAKAANVYYSQQNVEKAEHFYDLVLKDHPDHALSLRRMGDIYLYKGENFQDKTVEYNSKAFDFYTKALDIYYTYEQLTDTERLDIRDMNRRRDGAWTRIYRAGDSELNAKNTEKAMQIFELAHELKPDRFEPMIRLKDIYQDEFKDNDKAEQILVNLVKIDPENVDYNLEIGAFYFNLENFPKAVEYFAKVRDLAPANVNNLLNLAYAYYKVEEYGKGLSVIQGALELEPNNLEILESAAEIADRSNNKALKLGYLKRLLDIKQDADNYAAIAYTLNDLEQYQELVEYAQKWYQWDNSSKDAVMYIILGADKLQNEAMVKTFSNILKSM